MIKQFFKFSTLSLLVLLIFSSCSDSDDNIDIIKGDFDNGYFVSNEGQFPQPNGSVTFVSKDLSDVKKEIFKNVNGKALGSVVQSIAIEGDIAFLIVNNSNKIEVVNKTTFESIATITENINQPRYALVKNGKIYITNQGTTSVEIFDAQGFSHLKSIEVNKEVQEIINDGNFIYVRNTLSDAKWNNISNNITVIDSNTNTVVKNIIVGEGLNSIEIEAGILYALHNSGITKINTNNNEILGEIPFGEGLNNGNKLEVADNFLYFISGTNIYKFSTDATTLENTVLVDTKIAGGSGFGFNVIGQKIFYIDAKNFIENSEAFVYDLDGKFLKSFTVGVGANGFYGNY